MSLYVALLTHCSSYLENSLKVVRKALLNSANEDVPSLMPRTITRDQLQNANHKLLEMAMVGDQGLPGLIGHLFDNYMEMLLGDVVQYVNMSEDRKLAAQEYKLEKKSTESLIQEMSARAAELAEERTKAHDATVKEQLKELATLQSRVCSLEVELAEATASSLPQTPTAPASCPAGSSMVVVECVDWYGKKLSASANAIKCGEEPSETNIDVALASLQKQDDQQNDLQLLSNAIAVTIQSQKSKPVRQWRTQRSLRLLSFSTNDGAVSFAESLVEHHLPQEVDARVAIYSSPTPFIWKNDTLGFGGAGAGAAVRLLRMASDGGCIVTNFLPSLRPARLQSQLIGSNISLSPYLPWRESVWKLTRKDSRSTAATSTPLDDWSRVFLWASTERAADEMEDGLQAVSVPKNGAVGVLTLPKFNEMQRSSPSEARDFGAEVLRVARHSLCETDRITELSPPDVLSLGNPLRVVVVAESQIDLVDAACRAITEVESKLTWPNTKGTTKGAVQLQGAVSDVVKEFNYTIEQCKGVDGVHVNDLGCHEELLKEVDGMLSIAQPGEVAVPGVLGQHVEDSPELSRRLTVVSEGQLKSPVDPRRLARRMVPEHIERLASTTMSKLRRDKVQHPDGRSFIVSIGIDCMHWLSTVDLNGAASMLAIYEELLEELLVEYAGAVLSYDPEDGSSLCAFGTAVDAFKFCGSIHSKLCQQEWEPSLLRYRELAEVVQRDGQTVFRGPRIRCGVACGEAKDALYLLVRALNLCDVALGGETVTTASSSTLCYGMNIAHFEERDDVEVQLRKTSAVGPLREEATFRAMPLPLMGRKKGWNAPSADHHFTRRCHKQAMRHLRLCDAGGVVLRNSEQLEKNKTDEVIQPLRASRAAAAFKVLRQHAWRPGQYVVGFFQPPTDSCRVYRINDADRAAAAAEQNIQQLPYMPLTWERYEALRREFEALARDEQRSMATFDDAEDLRFLSETLVRELHTKIHRRMSPYMPRALSTLPDRADNQWSLRDLLQHYFPDALDEVLEDLDARWEAASSSRLSSQLLASAGTFTTSDDSDTQRRPSMMPRRISGIESAIAADKYSQLQGRSMRNLQESEAICRHLVRELALEKYRFFSTAWIAATKEETSKMEQVELRATNTVLTAKVKELNNEVTELRTLTMEVTAIKDQLKATKLEGMQTEATMKRSMAKAHYAVHALSSMIRGFSDSAVHVLAKTVEDPTLAPPPDVEALPFSEGQLLDDWSLLFDSVQQDTVRPYNEVPIHRPREVKASTVSQRATQHSLIVGSILKQPQEVSENTSHEQLLLSMLTAAYCTTEHILKLNRKAKEFVTQLDCEAKETRAVVAAQQSDLESAQDRIGELTAQLEEAQSLDRSGKARGKGVLKSEASTPPATPSKRPSTRDFGEESTQETNSLRPPSRSRSPSTSQVRSARSSRSSSPPSRKPSQNVLDTITSQFPEATNFDRTVGTGRDRIVAASTRTQSLLDGSASHTMLPDVASHVHEAYTACGSNEAKGICECCQARQAEVVCPGCWGAALCRKCLATLHGFLPTTLLKRGNHVMESGMSLTVEDTDGNLAMDTENSFAVTRKEHKVLIRRLPGAAGRGVWHPRDVNKSLMVTAVQPIRAASPVRTPPLEPLEAAEPIKRVEKRPESALSRRRRPQSATLVRPKSPPKPQREDRSKRR